MKLGALLWNGPCSAVIANNYTCIEDSYKSIANIKTYIADSYISIANNKIVW